MRMRVIEPGHIYELVSFDGYAPNLLIFVNREADWEHPGTINQEVLRAEIDVLDVDEQTPWDGNADLIADLVEAKRHLHDARRCIQRALLRHENRARERKMEKGNYEPEKEATGPDGHFLVPPSEER